MYIINHILFRINNTGPGESYWREPPEMGLVLHFPDTRMPAHFHSSFKNSECVPVHARGKQIFP